MRDRELVKEILTRILEATRKIEKRFADIRSPEDFSASERGEEKLDAICMQLIAIGEVVKKLDKLTAGDLLSRYPEIEWKRVMGMRDVLSHHYFDIDAEIVYSACARHVGGLATAVCRILDDLSSS